MTYYEHCCGQPYRRDDHWLRFFGAAADRIVSLIQPKRVLDAGCALGLLVEALRERGVDAEGVDISEYAIAHAPASVLSHCRVGSIAEELPGRYDLIVCIEVVEHMPAAEAEAAIANFCRHTDDVLFSSTPSDHREPTHVNVQPPGYWAELFARNGFIRDVDFDAAFLTAWAGRYRRRADPLPRIIRDYERAFADLAADRNSRRQYSAELQYQVEARDERIRLLEKERDDIHADRQALEERRVRERDALLEDHRRLADDHRREVDALQEEVRLVRHALEQTHADVTRKVVELDEANTRAAAVRAESDDRSHQLTHARATIEMMERSIFWRLRRLFGRR